MRYTWVWCRCTVDSMGCMLHVLVCASVSHELQLRNKLSGDFCCLLCELGKQRHNNFFLFPACLPFPFGQGQTSVIWGNSGTALREDIKGIIWIRSWAAGSGWLCLGRTRLTYSSPFQPLPFHQSVEYLTWRGVKGQMLAMLADSCLWASRILKRAFKWFYSSSIKFKAMDDCSSCVFMVSLRKLQCYNVIKRGKERWHDLQGFFLCYVLHSYCKNTWQFDCLLY